MTRAGRLVLAAALVLTGGVAFAAAPEGALRSARGETLELASIVRQQRLTVVVFFSQTCPCFAAHQSRLVELARELAPRGVRFVVVDSERHDDHVQAASLAPELPVLRDDGARLARRLDARYATEAFVFDATGGLRYRGGIDGDRKVLSATPKTYLRDALTALLQDRAPAFTSAKALGCVLRLR